MKIKYNLTEIALSQWSVIIQISILVILTFVFIALWLKYPRRSIFNWMFAWISNLLGLIVIFIILSLNNPPLWTTRLLFILYSLFKIWYAILLINGLWRYSQARQTRKSKLMKIIPLAFVGYAFLLFSFSLTNIAIQLITFFTIALILLVGSTYLFLQHNKFLINIVLLVFFLETMLFLHHVWQLSPILWGLQVPRSMTYMSFLDSIVELIVGITCLFAIVYQIIEEHQISNNEMEHAQKALRQLVDKDPLTDLWNRRKLKEFITTLDYQCTLVYMDINKFKDINDIWGHAMGDKCLIEITQLMNTMLNDEIGKFRLGGDEFLLVVPDKHKALIEPFKIKINQKLSINDQTPSYTLAIGIQSMNTQSEYETALQQADISMYQDKSN